MFRHLTPANYTEQPWANGRGRTIELLRQEDQGALLWRLSMAMVVEDGPFSLSGGTLALFALGEVTVNDIALQRHDLVLTDQEARVAGRWPVVAVRLYGEAGG
jgi:environmental stress-induced protein Ves